MNTICTPTTPAAHTTTSPPGSSRISSAATGAWWRTATGRLGGGRRTERDAGRGRRDVLVPDILTDLRMGERADFRQILASRGFHCAFLGFRLAAARRLNPTTLAAGVGVPGATRSAFRLIRGLLRNRGTIRYTRVRPEPLEGPSRSSPKGVGR